MTEDGHIIIDKPSEPNIADGLKKVAVEIVAVKKRMDAIEKKQTDYLLIDMEELAKYVQISIKNLDDIGSEASIYDVYSVKKSKGETHALVSCLDKLQDAGVKARMTKTVLFSIMNVMDRFQKKIIYNEESDKKDGV